MNREIQETSHGCNTQTQDARPIKIIMTCVGFWVFWYIGQVRGTDLGKGESSAAVYIGTYRFEGYGVQAA